MEAKALSILEHAHIAEMQEDLNRKLQESTKQDGAGKGDHLRRTILGLVVSEAYEISKTRLTSYVEGKVEFPAFQERVQRYVKHCNELIHAIETKRNFPGLASLSLSRQQEIHEKVIGHFEELKHNLRQIERIERDHKLVDVRSTVWVIKAITFVGFATFATAFFVDLRSGLLSSLMYTSNVWIDEASTWLVNLIL